CQSPGFDALATRIVAPRFTVSVPSISRTRSPCRIVAGVRAVTSLSSIGSSRARPPPRGTLFVSGGGGWPCVRVLRVRVPSALAGQLRDQAALTLPFLGCSLGPLRSLPTPNLTTSYYSLSSSLAYSYYVSLNSPVWQKSSSTRSKRSLIGSRR